MAYSVTVLPENRILSANSGDCLLTLLRSAQLMPDAPCGGNGTCGKCRVLVDGQTALACRTRVDRDMTVELTQNESALILTEGIGVALNKDSGLCLAVDIGTTTVAAYLTENGRLLATESRKNPQAAFGADVVSRLRQAAGGQLEQLTALIRNCLDDMTRVLLERTGKSGLQRICVVGNPAMQQLFLGLPVENLTRLPYAPILQRSEISDGGPYIPAWAGASLLTVPDIAGFIGGDLVSCILATGMDRQEALTLLVDIGTNGEMVLGNKHRLVACATAAGPALEGANIRFGMQAAAGAIDRVGTDFSCHVIGERKALGICGSGLLDAVAVALDQGLLNKRGRILNESRSLPLADGISLTQEDIRQIQQAKGAIAAGIRLMTQQLGVKLTDIATVYLAGAFGTFLDPHSACRTGLIPGELEGKLQPIGNAAGSGAMQLACDPELLSRADEIVSRTEPLELAATPSWARCFAESMTFAETPDYWCSRALGLGFTHAAALDTAGLTPREDVRAMCAADQCRAYGKNWTCPPHCGTLAQCREAIGRYHRGILLQTVGQLQKTIDTRAYRDTEAKHLRQFYALCDALRQVYPQALCLGSGGCRLCEKCAYPEPCRFPEKACPSMEGYGLFVTQVCRDNALAYHHGEKTVTYTACILF